MQTEAGEILPPLFFIAKRHCFMACSWQELRHEMLFFKRQARKLDQAIGLDIGSRQVKAVLLARREEGVELLQYAVEQNPAGLGKAGTESQLALSCGQTDCTAKCW